MIRWWKSVGDHPASRNVRKAWSDPCRAAASVILRESVNMMAPPCSWSVGPATQQSAYPPNVSRSIAAKPTSGLDVPSSRTAAPESPSVKHASRESRDSSISICAVFVRCVIYSPLTTRPHPIVPWRSSASTILTPANIPEQALLTSKTRALRKPNCFLSCSAVLGSNDTMKSGPSTRAIATEMRMSMSSGPWREPARQRSMASLARSIANSPSRTT